MVATSSLSSSSSAAAAAEEISRGDYSSLTAALIDLIFGMHTPIRSIGVVGYMNLTFEVIKGHLWEIFIILEG